MTYHWSPLLLVVRGDQAPVRTVRELIRFSLLAVRGVWQGYRYMAPVGPMERSMVGILNQRKEGE